jgi:hypothetical protein
MVRVRLGSRIGWIMRATASGWPKAEEKDKDEDDEENPVKIERGRLWRGNHGSYPSSLARSRLECRSYIKSKSTLRAQENFGYVWVRARSAISE